MDAGVRWEQVADRVVFSDYLLAVEHVAETLGALTATVERRPEAALLGGGRGTVLLPGHRHAHGDDARRRAPRLHALRLARGLMAFLGMVPCRALSSGGKNQSGRSPGPATHTRGGSSSRPPAVPAQPRCGSLLAAARGRSASDHRPGRQGHAAPPSGVFNRFVPARKAPAKLIVAVARELIGFIWAAMRDASVASG